MTDGEYKILADAFFARLETALEGIDEGVDFELASGGILEIDFDDGSKMVINRQGATHEIWVAARAGGFHYRWDGEAWRDTRGGEEIFVALSRFASDQAGVPIRMA
jgi:CyaY protein